MPDGFQHPDDLAPLRRIRKRLASGFYTVDKMGDLRLVVVNGRNGKLVFHREAVHFREYAQRLETSPPCVP